MQGKRDDSIITLIAHSSGNQMHHQQRSNSPRNNQGNVGFQPTHHLTPRVGSMTAPAPIQSQSYEEAKHGTSNEAQRDPRSGASNQSHAPHHEDEDNHHESKDNNDSDDAYSDDPKSRTSASSRVNFSKLTAEEKERRCHNMSKEVKQLRRKIRNMEERLARSSGGTDYRQGEDNNSGLSDTMVQRAKEKIKSYQGYELSDQKDLIENLCAVITQDRLKTDSLAYYMICTLVRSYLTNEEWNKYEQNGDHNDDKDDNNDKEILVSFPEKEVRISKKEFQFFAPYHENEQIMRLLTGQLSDKNLAQVSTASQQPEQIDMLLKAMQSNPNMQNLNQIAGLQNLMNTPSYGSMSPNHGQNPSSNMMSSMMNSQNPQNPMYSMNPYLQSQMPQHQNSQFMNTLMNGQLPNPNSNMQWGMGQMNGMNGGYPGMDKQP